MLYFILLAIFCGCSNQNEPPKDASRKQNQIGEYIYRNHDEYHFAVEEPKKSTPAPYPWEETSLSEFPRITKDFFRCKGSTLNPAVIIQSGGKEAQRYHDCGGAEKHSLPLRDNKEFIYPVLIDILNFIQQKTGKRVIVTCGHRCPDHNTYSDPSVENQTSKHMIGADVSFYVFGMENQPEQILKYIQEYFKVTPKYKGLKEYQEFTRYEKGDSHVSTQPWMNKEIFVKLYKKKEGRDFDNRHPYPYLSLQVRYDWDTQEKVVYGWDKAFKNFLRY